jgi:sugar lactone lactonase YvrE
VAATQRTRSRYFRVITVVLSLAAYGHVRAQSIYATPYTFTSLAGSPGVTAENTPGMTFDGVGTGALFFYPFGVAVDTQGAIYVGDLGETRIRKITSGGVVTTFAGAVNSPGSNDGTLATARFNEPGGVAFDSAGNLFVTDFGNNTIRKISSAGVVTTIAGSAGIAGSADGVGAAARFNQPIGITVDAADNVYVADHANDTVRKITANGVVTTIAGSAGIIGSADGVGSAALFNGPAGIDVDKTGNLYVVDYGNDTIRKIDGSGVVTTLAGSAGVSGSADGTGAAALFNGPLGIAIDSNGVIYIGDGGNSTIRKIAGGAVVTTLAGLAGSPGAIDGTGAAARFLRPCLITVDSVGNIYVPDGANATVDWGALSAPSLVSARTATGYAGQSFSYALIFSGVLGGYTATGLPLGLSLDPSSGQISGIPGATGNYPVTVGATNGAGSSTTVLTVAITAVVPPGIATQPQSQTVYAGASVSFGVAATGNPAPAYQWYLNGLPIPGATNPIYSIASASAASAGSYTVTVTNIGGQISGSATLTIAAFPVFESGGRGGGAPSLWFYGALAVIVAFRRWLLWQAPKRFG